MSPSTDSTDSTGKIYYRMDAAYHQIREKALYNSFLQKSTPRENQEPPHRIKIETNKHNPYQPALRMNPVINFVELFFIFYRSTAPTSIKTASLERAKKTSSFNLTPCKDDLEKVPVRGTGFKVHLTMCLFPVSRRHTATLIRASILLNKSEDYLVDYSEKNKRNKNSKTPLRICPTRSPYPVEQVRGGMFFAFAAHLTFTTLQRGNE